jgi:predicted RecA/RadA family phage recombinase
MKNFVQPGHVVTATASADGVMLGELIVGATSPVLYSIGTAMKVADTSVRARLDGVAVVAAGT